MKDKKIRTGRSVNVNDGVPKRVTAPAPKRVKKEKPPVEVDGDEAVEFIIETKD